MPDYQSLSDPSQIHSKSNPYITKHYRKDKSLIKKRSRRDRGDRGPDSPLIRDLLILRDGMETIMGYDQLSGEGQETAEATFDPDVSELKPSDITPDVGQPKETDEPERRENTGVPPSDPMPKDDAAHAQRGERRRTQYSPEEIELLRRAMLLINKGN